MNIMANKFINNMCYFNYEKYFNNMEVTPYHFVLDIEKIEHSDNVYISTVDLRGKSQTIYLSKSSMYKNVKVMSYDKLFYEKMIQAVFIYN